MFLNSKHPTCFSRFFLLLLISGICFSPLSTLQLNASWTADNGNGTYTNPLFYDEFSDPDIIRVGDDFYMAGTTMHSMPGVVVLHSKDLVNWSFLSYCFDQLELDPGFKLEDGKEIYGQGIWAPCIRFHNGKFYVFSNINGHGMQVFISDDPAGPWQHQNLGGRIYDLSVLFDDNGKIYAVHGYDEVHLIEIKPDFSGYVEGSERVIIPRGNAMGEGHHFYKIDGKYYILSANFAPVGRMQCARADNINGPYETTVVSMRETLGTERGWLTQNIGLGRPLPEPGYEFQLTEPGGNYHGAVPLHQGGIVDLPNGDWWGFSMMDFRSVGRTTCLSPVTWQDGWPYFGLPGNLGRSPRTWFKPKVEEDVEPSAPYARSDDFSDSELSPIWQWNHAPDTSKWSLTENPGRLRLHTLPAKSFMWARNSLTQRAIGPVSQTTVEIDLRGLQSGDLAGMGLLNLPYAWAGVSKSEDDLRLSWYDQFSDETIETVISNETIWLRIVGDFDHDIAHFEYSLDGELFQQLGTEVRLPYQLKTFQGTRIALFAFNRMGQRGGYADFDNFEVYEPMANRSENLPLGKILTFKNLGNDTLVWANPHGMLHSTSPDSDDASGKRVQFRIHDRGQGRVVLEAMDGSGFVSVTGAGLSGDVRMIRNETEDCLFMWQDMLRGQCMLLSLKTNRYLGMDPATGEPYAVDWAGTHPDRKDGTVFAWKVLETSAEDLPGSTPEMDCVSSWINPILPQRADPHVYLHSDGYYYLVATVPEYDRIELRRARTIDGLRDAPAEVVWRRPEAGPMSGVVWAPEIHFLDGKWVLYFSGGTSGAPWHSVRLYALENESMNPLDGEWKELGRIQTEWDSFSLDPTVFEHEGKRYFLWTQQEPGMQGTNIYIAPMDSSTSIVGSPTLLTRPEFDWEREVYLVNEAPAVLVRNGKIFITYSASATDHHYCLGMLTANADADILDPASWEKSPTPVLKSCPETSQFGPGHNSFTTTKDGGQDIIVYHSRNFRNIEGDPLANPDRATRAQVVKWKPDGTPDFDVPVEDGIYAIPSR